MDDTPEPKNEVAVRQSRTNEPGSLLNVIARAMEDERFDVTKLEALLRMQRELVSDRARHEFSRAMSEAQGEMRAVYRGSSNEQTHSRYAKLEKIDDVIRPIYTRHGFSLTFGTEKPVDPASIKVVCECAHSGGHTKQYELEAPPDQTGARGQVNKTVLHGMGSTISYLRRYLTTMIFNVVLTNEDDDGNAGGISGGMGENIERRPPPPRPAASPPPPAVARPARRTLPGVLDDIEKKAAAALTEEDLDNLDKRDEDVAEVRAFAPPNAKASMEMRLAFHRERVRAFVGPAPDPIGEAEDAWNDAPPGEEALPSIDPTKSDEDWVAYQARALKAMRFMPKDEARHAFNVWRSDATVTAYLLRLKATRALLHTELQQVAAATREAIESAERGAQP